MADQSTPLEDLPALLTSTWCSTVAVREIRTKRGCMGVSVSLACACAPEMGLIFRAESDTPALT